jgi:hypothetical protein
MHIKVKTWQRTVRGKPKRYSYYFIYEGDKYLCGLGPSKTLDIYRWDGIVSKVANALKSKLGKTIPSYEISRMLSRTGVRVRKIKRVLSHATRPEDMSVKHLPQELERLESIPNPNIRKFVRLVRALVYSIQAYKEPQTQGRDPMPEEPYKQRFLELVHWLRVWGFPLWPTLIIKKSKTQITWGLSLLNLPRTISEDHIAQIVPALLCLFQELNRGNVLRLKVCNCGRFFRVCRTRIRCQECTKQSSKQHSSSKRICPRRG